MPPVTVPVHCRLWNMEWGGVQSVECEESEVLSGVTGVQSVKWDCGVWSVNCKVRGVKCKVSSVKCKLWTVKYQVWTVECKV